MKIFILDSESNFDLSPTDYPSDNPTENFIDETLSDIHLPPVTPQENLSDVYSPPDHLPGIQLLSTTAIRDRAIRFVDITGFHSRNGNKELPRT